MGGLECVITGLMDEYNSFFKKRNWARERFTFAVIGISFCVALINVTPVKIINNYYFITSTLHLGNGYTANKINGYHVQGWTK